MNYSITNLTQVNDCNDLLNWAAQERNAMEHKRANQAFTNNRYAAVAQSLRDAHQLATVEMTGLDAVLATQPQGNLLAETLDKKRRLEYRLYLLEGRLAKYGTVPQIEKEVDLSLTENELEEMDHFIAQVEDRKTFLENQARA